MVLRPLLNKRLIACFVLLLDAACNGPCSERSIEKCTEDPGCFPISGQPLDEDQMCKGQSRVVGCGEVDRRCGQAITYAKNSDQVTWEFDDTCLPEGWESIEGPQAVDWELCE